MRRRNQCPKSAELMAFADGEQVRRDRLRIGEHIADCERCARQVDALQRLSRRISAARTLPPGRPVDIAGSVMTRIAAERARPRSSWRRAFEGIVHGRPAALGWGSAALALAILLVIGVSVTGPQPPPVPEVSPLFGAAVQVDVETDLEADVYFFANEAATVVWIEVDAPGAPGIAG